MVQKGAKKAENLRELAENSEIIFSMVRTGEQLEQVTLGESGLFNWMKPGSVLITTSTIPPSTIRRIYEEGKKKGIEMVDAPVSGGRVRAEDGTMCLMASCTNAVWEQCREAMATVGSDVIHVDERPGNGQVYKAANQIFVYAHYALTAEVILMAEKAGIDTEMLASVIRRSRGNSVIFDKNVEKYIHRNFTMNSTSHVGKKDLHLVVDFAKELNTPIPITRIVCEMYDGIVEKGWGDEDLTIIMRLYEDMAKSKGD
jgi:3-hydroxyisobutyrate dehydrogenase-like beta-hydroxyacid dehydrogenase